MRPEGVSSSEPLRCAVVGVGHLGRWHADKYHGLEGCDLVAVADVDPVRAGEVADRLGCEAVADYRALLGRVDAVSIAVPTEQHHTVAREFLSAGAHVLVEKPITVSVSQADELIDLAARQARVLAVGHLERFNPVLAACRLPAGPRFIEAHRLAPFPGRGTDVDVVLDLMIHDLDIILHVVDEELVDVAAVGAPVLTGSPDIANARLTFAGGCVANVTASRVSLDVQRKMRMFFADTYVSLDFHRRSFTRCRRDPSSEAPPVPGIALERATLEAGDSLLEEISHFVTCIRGDSRPRVGGEEGRKALALASRISHLIAARQREERG